MPNIRRSAYANSQAFKKNVQRKIRMLFERKNMMQCDFAITPSKTFSTLIGKLPTINGIIYVAKIMEDLDAFLTH